MLKAKELCRRIDEIRKSQPKVYFGMEVFGHIVFIEPKDLRELSERMWTISRMKEAQR